MAIVEIEVDPQDCADKRQDREQRIALIREVFQKKVDRQTFGAIFWGTRFFTEAITCYRSCNYVASIAMCGASIENLLLDLLLVNHKNCYRDKGGNVAWSPIQEFKDGRFRNYFRELVARNDGSFNKRNDVMKKLRLDMPEILAKSGNTSIDEDITSVLELRDQAMHYIERTYRQFFTKAADGTFSDFEPWPFLQKKSENTLEKTLRIISFASEKYLSKLPC